MRRLHFLTSCCRADRTHRANIMGQNEPQRFARTVVSDDDDDHVPLDPALARIASQVAERGHTADVVDTGGSDAKVTLTVAMRLDPTIRLTEHNTKGLKLWQTPVDVQIGRVRRKASCSISSHADRQPQGEDFRRVWAIVAAKKGMDEGELKLTYKNRLVYQSATPASLGIYAGRAELLGYRASAYEAVQEAERKREAQLIDGTANGDDADGADSDLEIVEASSSPVRPPSGKQLTLKGRNGDEHIVSCVAICTLRMSARANVRLTGSSPPTPSAACSRPFSTTLTSCSTLTRHGSCLRATRSTSRPRWPTCPTLRTARCSM